MTSKCQHLAELLKAQEAVIKADIDGHKYLKGIPTTEEGMISFVNEHGYVMRQVYCGYACSDRKDCEIAKEFLPKEIKLYDATQDPDVLSYFSLKSVSTDGETSNTVKN